MTTEIIIVKIRIVAYYFIFLAGAEMAVQPVLIIWSALHSESRTNSAGRIYNSLPGM